MEMPINIGGDLVSIIFAIVVFIIGFGAMIGAVFSYFANRKLVATAKTIEGTVFDVGLVREIQPRLKGDEVVNIFSLRVRFVTDSPGRQSRHCP